MLGVSLATQLISPSFLYWMFFYQVLGRRAACFADWLVGQQDVFLCLGGRPPGARCGREVALPDPVCDFQPETGGAFDLAVGASTGLCVLLAVWALWDQGRIREAGAPR